jgi:hypothetical protein
VTYRANTEVPSIARKVVCVKERRASGREPPSESLTGEVWQADGR